MSARMLTRGAPVIVGTVAPSPIRGPEQNRDYGVHRAETVRPYPGGRYDSGTMWVVRRANGSEEIADESMLTPLGGAR